MKTFRTIFDPRLVGHDAFTVAYMGWSRTKNGKLLQLAADEQFDVMITMDDGVGYHQNIKTLPIAIFILNGASKDTDDLAPLVPAILLQLSAFPSKSIVRISASA